MKRRIIALALSAILVMSVSAGGMAEEILDNEPSAVSGMSTVQENVTGNVAEDAGGDQETVILPEEDSAIQQEGDGVTADGGEPQTETGTDGVPAELSGDGTDNTEDSSEYDPAYVYDDVQVIDICEVQEYGADGAEEIVAEEEAGPFQLSESGLASDAAMPLFSLYANTEYGSAYGEQLEGDAKALYDQMVASYVTVRGSEEFEYTLQEKLTFTTVGSVETDASGKKVLQWDSANNKDYQEVRETVRSIVQSAYDALVYDYPEIFWMSAPAYRWSNSFTVAVASESTYTGTVGPITLTPQEKYTGAASEIAAFDAAVDAVYQQLQEELQGVTSSYTTMETVRAIHDYICDAVTYAEGAYARTAAGVFLKDKLVVCEGYAKAFKILCRKFKIDSVLIPGVIVTRDEGHMWNYVKMDDGKWYLVDATWDDGASPTYRYFLAGSATIPSGTSTPDTPLGEAREIYNQFSKDTNTQAFVMPDLNSNSYHTEHPSAHLWSEYVSDGNATCTEAGTQTAHCEADRCTETDTKEVAALGHSFTNYISDGNATCTEAGTQTAKCDRCDATDTKEEAALGHSFTNYISDGNATCTEDGTKTAVCDRCGVTDTVIDVGSALGHSFTNYVSDGNATCGQDGTKTAVCDRCDATDTVADVGSATGAHIYDQGVVTTATTAVSEGVLTYTCTVCGAVKTEPIERLPATIALNASTLLLQVGQSTSKLTVSGLAAGDSVASWKSSKPKIVSVTANGKIKGKKTGTAYVTVTLESGLSEQIKVKVQKKAVSTTGISGVAKTLTMKKGKKVKLNPVVTPITSLEKVTYTSSNKKVAAVSAKGKITAKKKGKAVITVKSGRISVKCKVTVK